VAPRRGRGGLHGAAHTHHTHAGRFKAERRHRRVWRALIAFAAVVVLVVVAGVAGFFYVQYRVGSLPRIALAAGVLEASPAGSPYDVLLVGAGASGGPGTALVVARVVPAERAVELLAIPSTLELRPPGKTAADEELGVALVGGATTLVEVIEQDLHIPLAHLGEVELSGIGALVDSMGGLRLDFPMPLEEESTGLRIGSAGCQAVNGDEAATLVASESPYYLPGHSWQQWSGDYLTQLWMEESLLASLLTAAGPSMGNPLGLLDLVRAVGGAVRVDPAWGGSALMGAAGQLAGISPSGIGLEILPTALGAGGQRSVDAATAAAISAWLALGVRSHAPAPAGGAPPWGPTPC
jgi:hypothetical protein